MKFRSVRRIVAFESQVIKYDLDWSFRPVFNSMRILGFDLSVSNRPSKCRRCGFFLLGICILISTSIYSTYNDRKRLYDKKEQSSIFLWRNLFIISRGIIMQAAIFTITFFKWETVRRALEELEHSICFSARIHHQTRKIHRNYVTIGLIMVRLHFHQNFI